MGGNYPYPQWVKTNLREERVATKTGKKQQNDSNDQEEEKR